MKFISECKEEVECCEYEEMNFVCLFVMSKKDKVKKV